MILGTTSAPRDDIFISIWRYNPAKPHEPSGLIKLWETVVTIFNTTLKLMVLAITFAYLYQNMDDTVSRVYVRQVCKLTVSDLGKILVLQVP